jgi:hypothetical protein
MEDNVQEAPVGLTSWIGPVIVCLGLLVNACLILFVARHEVYALRGFGIPNIFMAGLLCLLAILALSRRVSFAYYFMAASVFIILLQILVVRTRLAEPEVSLIVDSIHLALLIITPLRARDFGFAGAKDFLEKVFSSG